MADFNTQIIEEFRANDGKVGGPFEGAPVLLLHHVGRKSGRQLINPMMYLPDDADDAVVYVFASYAGQPKNSAWYYNVTAADQVTVERGTEIYDASATELTGGERDGVYARQAALYPGFAEYEEKTAGIRTIPVLALRRI